MKRKPPNNWARCPVPLAVQNFLALHGYEAREAQHPSSWDVTRISDGVVASSWTFRTPSTDYIKAMADTIAAVEAYDRE